MADPTGAQLQMNLAWLSGTPFSNFLIPGIVLFAINGLGNALVPFVLLKHRRLYTQLAFLLGLFMIAWIISQVAWIGYKSFLQPLYFSTGLIQAILTFWLWKSNSLRQQG